MALQGMAISLPTWVVEHPVTRLELVKLVEEEEDSGVALLLVEYLAICLAPLHLASTIVDRILIPFMVGAPQGSAHRLGDRQDGVAAMAQSAVEAAALAQELPLVVKYFSLTLCSYQNALFLVAFYRATAMLSAVYAVVVCLCVCVCVCVCVSVCLCVCLSHSGIVSKRLNVGSCKQRRTIAS